MFKLNARELRECDEADVKGQMVDQKRNPIYLILENVYDTYNVGGLFRLADALKAEKIYLCGQTEIPPNSKIKKASIGTYKIVPWTYCKTTKEAIDELRQISNFQFPISIVAVEQSPKSVPYTQANYSSPVALIVGNETYGVLPETLELVDQIVEIPMWGINKSLNVIVSAAIVSYWVMNKCMIK